MERNKRNEDWSAFANRLGFIRLILVVDWDPIRLFGIPATLDEYDNDAEAVLTLLEKGSPDVLIVAHLKQIESEQMGIRGSTTEQLFPVVGKLKAAYSRWYEYGARQNTRLPD